MPRFAPRGTSISLKEGKSLLKPDLGQEGEEMPYRKKNCEQSNSVVPGNGHPHRTHVTSGTMLTIASEFYVL
jgi:hypothetical protein